MIHLYGIPNCDTVKKARRWLDDQRVEYAFHDFKKESVRPDRLARWARAVGWERLLNRRGTTFRKLGEEDKRDLDEAKALALMAEHPSLIKRPVVEAGAQVFVGFSPEEWRAALGAS